MAEVFVNDAFGTAHRAHSSTAGVAEFLPAVAGFLIEKEIKFLGSSFRKSTKTICCNLRWSKRFQTKLGVIEALLEKVDKLIIGGGMAYTFFKSIGYSVGKSICELDKLDLSTRINETKRKKEMLN